MVTLPKSVLSAAIKARDLSPALTRVRYPAAGTPAGSQRIHGSSTRIAGTAPGAPGDADPNDAHTRSAAAAGNRRHRTCRAESECIARPHRSRPMHLE